MRKLNIHSIAGLTRFAVAHGLIPMPELALACGSGLRMTSPAAQFALPHVLE